MLLVCFLLLATFIVDLVEPAQVVFNASSTCTTQQACLFNDPAIWMNATLPGSLDDVVVRGENKNKQTEIFINSSVSVKSITLFNNVVLSVREYGFLNTSKIAWKAPSTIQVDSGRLHAGSGIWSETGSNINNGSLVVTNGGRFTISESTEVGNATIANNSMVQMINFKVFETLTVVNSRLNVRFIDALNVVTEGSNTIDATSLFIGQYASFSGNLATDYLSSFATNQINFVNSTATIPDLEVGTLSITSSNLTLTPSNSLLSLNITDSNVTFVAYDDNSDYTADDESPSTRTSTRDAANETVSFQNVFLANANITMLTKKIGMCNLQINSNSTINGNMQVTCGISFTAPSLIVNGNYTQSESTYMNISTSANTGNHTFLRVYGAIQIIGTEIYKDITVQGINGTIRLATSLPGQINATVEEIHDPFLAAGLVDEVTIDEAKGRMLLVPTKPKGPKQTYFYTDWRYITAAVLLTLLAIGTFALAKYLRRTRELDERLLQEGDNDKRNDSSEDEEEEEEEIDGMGEKRLSFRME